MYKYELPSGTEVELREMTGAEEELLTNARLIRSGDAINHLLRNCIVRLGDATEVTDKDVLDLLSGDRLFILVKLREISLGNEVDLELSCANSSCRETNLLAVDLSEVKATKYGTDREFVFELPASKRKVHFAHLDGNKEKRLAALKEPTISSAMLIRILDVDGKPPTKKLLSEMSLRDRTALRKAMQKVDAGPDTAVALDCEACGSPIRTRLEAEPAFFFPEAH